MTSKLRNSILMFVVAALLIVPSVATAGSGDVIRDCAQDGALDGKYSQGELQGALNGLPSDLDEYTDCRSVIRNATLTKAGGDRSSNPSASVSRVDASTPPTVGEEDSIRDATISNKAVKIGDKSVRPGEAGFLAASYDSDIPTLLVALIVAFAIATLGGAAFAFQRRWPETANAAAATAARPFKAIGRGVKRGVSRFRS